MPMTGGTGLKPFKKRTVIYAYAKRFWWRQGKEGFYETKIIKKFSVVLIVERRFGEVHAR